MNPEVSDDQLQSFGIISRIIRTELNRVLKPYGLNDSNYFFIFYIADHPESSQGDLTRKMFLDHSTITRSVAKLVELGYLEKHLDEKDHRTTRLFLTDKGAEIRHEIHELTTTIFDNTFTEISLEESANIKRLLLKTANHLENTRSNT